MTGCKHGTVAGAGLRMGSWMLVCLVVAAGSRAQTRILTGEGPIQSVSIGKSIAPAGDLDGDGTLDILAGDGQPASMLGLVSVVSGLDGSLIGTFWSPAEDIGFGVSCDGDVDIDGDTVPDVLIGANLGNSRGFSFEFDGSVFLYSGRTKALIREHVGVAGQFLGDPVRFLEDMNGDGVAEYGAGAKHDGGFASPAEVGEAFVYCGATGEVLFALSEGEPGDFFGESIESVGDLDGDGVSDFAVGACRADVPPYTNNGAVYLFSGATGRLIRMDSGEGDDARYGREIARLGDVDDDGIEDYATSWFTGGPGAVAVISGASGEMLIGLKSSIEVPSSPALHLGSIADLDGDGHREVFAGAYGNVERHVYVASPTTGDVLYIIRDEDPPGSSFPGPLANLGELDHDGIEEIGVGDVAGAPGGAVYAYSLRPLYALEKELPQSGGAVPFGLTGGTACAEGPYALLASVSGSRPGFAVGQVQVPLNFDLLTSFSVSLANVPPFVDTFGTLDAETGRGAAAFDLTAVPLPPTAIGITLHFAFVAKCGSGPWNVVSNAEAVSVVP